MFCDNIVSHEKGEIMKTLEEYRFNCRKHNEIRLFLKDLSRFSKDNSVYSDGCYSHVDENIKAFIDNFLSVTFGKFQFRDLEDKLKTLKIGYLHPFWSFVFGVYGYYDVDKHLIEVGKKLDDSIYHELFHAMTSFRIDDFKSGCGFTQWVNGVDIAHMFDEGYTDLLSNRYFQSEISYNIAANIALKVESMISREKMESMYSLNQTSVIFQFLSENSSLYNTIKFFMLLDKTFAYGSVSKKSIGNFNALSNYLVDVYLKYLSKLYASGKMNRNVLIESLEIFRDDFTKHVFDVEEDEEYYLESPEYYDITQKLGDENFKKMLKRNLS